MIAQHRGYLAELTYERSTKNFTAPSFPSHVYPWRYFVAGFSIKYFYEDRKLFSGSKHKRLVFVRKIQIWCLKRYHYNVIVNKAKECKIIERHERFEYFLKECIDGKGTMYLYPLSCYSTGNDIISLLRITIGYIVTNQRNWYNILAVWMRLYTQKMYNCLYNFTLI